MKTRIRQSFNHAVNTYDHAADLQKDVAHTLSTWLPQQTIASILEIGCGTGIFSQYVRATYPTTPLLLTDIAPAMLDTCRHLFVTSGQHIEYACLDAEHLAINSQFDLITSNMALHWFLDIQSGIKQILRHLTHGGHFIFSLPGSESLREWHAICQTHALPIGTPHFPSLTMLKKWFPAIKFHSEKVTQHFPDGHTFLRHFSLLGTRVPHSRYTAMSAGTLRRAIRQLQHPMIINYEIIYGMYHNL